MPVVERELGAPARIKARAEKSAPYRPLPPASGPTNKWSNLERDAAAALGSPSTGLSSEKSRAQLETYLMALELEVAQGALPPAEGGRRKRGGGVRSEIVKKSFDWLWGKISGSAPASAVAESDTAAALKEVLAAASKVPVATAKKIDDTLAASIRMGVPVVNLGASAIGPGVAFVATSYAYSHPSLAIGIADYATRLAATIVDNVGGLGPDWATLMAETQKSVTILAGSALNVGNIAANRPYLAAAIAWFLLDQYAKSRGDGQTALSVLKDTGNAVAAKASKAAGDAAGAASEFGGDFKSVVVTQWNDFNIWLQSRSRLDAPTAKTQLEELGKTFKAAIVARAAAAAKTAAEQEKTSPLNEDGSPKAGQGEAPSSKEEGEAPESGDGSDKMTETGGRRRLTSRRLRRSSGPRRTRRSSSGRRRGNSRRRRV